MSLLGIKILTVAIEGILKLLYQLKIQIDGVYDLIT